MNASNLTGVQAACILPNNPPDAIEIWVKATTRPGVTRPAFRYTDAQEVLHSVPVDTDNRVAVVGAPESGSYEWVIVTPAGIWSHSDDGYGSPAVALRDGLIAYYATAARGTFRIHQK